MVTLECRICHKSYEAHYANRLYCSAACKQKAFRASKAAKLAEAAPARAELVTKLERFAPETGALARKLIDEAGAECTELIVRLVAQAVREIAPKDGAGALVATNGTKAKAEGVPMK